MEYLDFWVTWNGIRSRNNKLETIVNIIAPKTTKQVREFIIFLDYYRYILSRRSHSLQPLTALTLNKVKLKCTDVEQKAFGYINHIFARDSLLSYLDFNKCFYIHTDASYYQLGELIIQEDKPISFYRHKLAVP